MKAGRHGVVYATTCGSPPPLLVSGPPAGTITVLPAIAIGELVDVGSRHRYMIELERPSGYEFREFAEEIVEPVATRVFARSAFEYGHDPDPAFADTFVALLVRR